MSDKQTAKQTVAEFYDHLLDLCVRGYPTMAEHEDFIFQLMKRRFLNGLSSVNVIMMLRATHDLDTAAALKKRAVQLEEVDDRSVERP